MNSIKFLLLIGVIFTSTNNYSQNREKLNRVKAYKIAYITDLLNLTTNEAELFWPIYNAHEKLLSQYREKEINAMESIVKNPNKQFSSPKNLDNIDESEAKKIYNIVTDIRIKTHQENKRYFTNVATILSYKKILKLQIAEREFKKELFRKLRHLKGRTEDN